MESLLALNQALAKNRHQQKIGILCGFASVFYQLLLDAKSHTNAHGPAAIKELAIISFFVELLDIHTWHFPVAPLPRGCRKY